MQIKGHDPNDPTGLKWVDMSEEARKDLLSSIVELEAQTFIESINEPATALYYILQALAAGDYTGAAFEGLASAIPFLPKWIGDWILVKLLPKKWVPLETLLASAKNGNLKLDDVRREVKRGRML